MTYDNQDLKNYILKRVEKRTGKIVTWEELLASPFTFGGVDTINDLLDSELVEIDKNFKVSDRYHK